MNVQSPLDYAYERFGQTVAPQDKTAWLFMGNAARKKGDVIIVAEHGVRIYGTAWPSASHVLRESKAAAREALNRYCFAASREHWLAMILGQGYADPPKLVLNYPGVCTTAVYDVRSGAISTYCPSTLSTVSQSLCGLTPSRAVRLIELAAGFEREQIGEGELSELAVRELESILEKYPRALDAAKTYLRAGTMPPAVLGAYMKHAESAS